MRSVSYRSLEHFSQNLIPSFVRHQAFTAKLMQHLASTQTNSQTKEKQELYQQVTKKNIQNTKGSPTTNQFKFFRPKKI
jgi:hypothetical protein